MKNMGAMTGDWERDWLAETQAAGSITPVGNECGLTYNKVIVW